MSKKNKKVENVEAMRAEVEETISQEKFGPKEIAKLMKKSGLSYKQIMQGMKKIAEETEEYAKTQGDDFDRKEFLKQQLKDKLGNK